MKKLIPIITLLLVTSLSLSAQSRKGKKKQRPAKTEAQASTSDNRSTRSKVVEDGMSLNPRADRKIAITAESGIKTISGYGINGTYYISPKIAVDVGAGFGLQLIKGGIRGRYLILDQKFSPYVGAGLFFHPYPIENAISFDEDGLELPVELFSSTFGQFTLGAEYVGNRGFVIGFNLGYGVSLTGDNWSTSRSITQGTKDLNDFLYGSSFGYGLNIGWAF